MSDSQREEAGIVFFPDEEPLLSNILHTHSDTTSLMAGYSHKKSLSFPNITPVRLTQT